MALAAGAAHSWIVPVKLRPEGLARGAPTPPTGQAPQQTDGQAPAGPIDPASLGAYISLAEAYALWESGVVFLDTRTKAKFDESRIMGAYHLSTEEFGTPAAAEALAALRPDKPYVLYCDGGDCDASENVATRLEGAGYTRFHILKDGFPAWQAAGYETEPFEEGP